jgi:uncharacterized protein (UPF0212 family)
MYGLSPVELLESWERGSSATPAEQAVALLSAVGSQALDQPVGVRDSGLLELHEVTFGPELEGVAACPACGERLDVALDAHELRSPAVGVEPATGPFLLEEGGYVVSFRLPTSRDLLALSDRREAEAAPRFLLERCLLSVTVDGRQVAAEELPASIAESVAGLMAEEDPAADIRLAMSCPECGHEWAAAFDIVAFLWEKVDAWAKRLLLEVHTLASAYGWSEEGILAMSPARRGIYLELAGG